MPCGGLLEARLPQGITWNGKRVRVVSSEQAEATGHVPTSLRNDG